MKNARHSAVLCLALTASMIFTAPTIAQEERYVTGVGVVVDSYGNVDVVRSMEAAKNDLYAKVLEVIGKRVSNHTVVKNSNGNHDYKSVTAVDTGMIVADSDIQYIERGGFWEARVEISKVIPEEVVWKEEHITVNNTYHSPTEYRNGYRITEHTTRTTRTTNVIGPSGIVVRVIPGRGSTTSVMRRWNGRCGITRTSTVTDR